MSYWEEYLWQGSGLECMANFHEVIRNLKLNFTHHFVALLEHFIIISFFAPFILEQIYILIVWKIFSSCSFFLLYHRGGENWTLCDTLNSLLFYSLAKISQIKSFISYFRLWRKRSEKDDIDIFHFRVNDSLLKSPWLCRENETFPLLFNFLYENESFF